jgi:hypothetical protein
MSIDTARTVGTVGKNGIPVPMTLQAIIDEAVTEAALAPTGTTASADELNILDGATVTTDELNTLADVVAGTTSASSALVVDTHKQLDALNVTTLGVGAARLAMSGSVRAGRHSVSAGEDTANTCDIVTGATTIVAQDVQILRSGAVATGNAAVSVSGGTITVADGATYVLTSGDVINWIAVGA